MSPEPRIEPLAFSVLQASQVLNVSERTVWTLIGRGELVPRRIGKRTLITRVALENFLKRSHPTGNHKTEKG